MNYKLALFAVIFSHFVSAQELLRINIQRAQRRVNSLIVRNAASKQRSQENLQTQTTNGDEALYSDKRGTFGKSLAHFDTGFIKIDSFNQMLAAIKTANATLFNQITMGTSPVERRLVSPQAAYAINLDGADGWIHTMPAAPTLASAETAGEMVEVYWHALLRDVAFNDFDTDITAAAAIADLNRLSDFKGPKVGGVVTAQSLFRGNTPGDLIGPFISQFLYLPIPYGPGPNYDGSGSLAIQYQQQIVPEANIKNDFVFTFTDWLPIQRGANPEKNIIYGASQIFIRTARDLADYVHQDYPQQTFINAALILLSFGSDALDKANPYISNPTQESFTTYGTPDIIYMISVATEIALRTAWYQKWVVHRRTRPEFVGFLTNQQKSGAKDFGLHSDLINSSALTNIFSIFGTYFLPQAYPEGSPTHPSYPAGHATVAGACITILKAFFNEDFVIPSPVEPNAGNTALVAYIGDTLRVGNELNKLAANILLGRDMAGVHYRSDGAEGMNLGEKVALSLLSDESFTRNIPFNGFTLTTFDGTKITVGTKQTVSQL
jgi:membrane-associated phospholipid phosphatase